MTSQEYDKNTGQEGPHYVKYMKLICNLGMKKISLQTQILTYPCQYAGVNSHNLRQTFHGFSPYSDGTFPKDPQNL